MNFIKGRLSEQNGYTFVREASDCNIFLGAHIPDSLKKYLDKDVLLAVRPEHIVVCDDLPNEQPDCILQVIAYENMGNEQLIYLSLAEQTIIVRRPPREIPDVGMKHGIRFLKEKIIFIDEETGAVIDGRE
jgi:ABC-type sugar transport system ATPase subunit